jgi:hypothetical protein
MHVLILVLTMPGLACVYAFFARPLLKKIPALAQFYSEADGFWSKVWAVCGKEVELAFGYLLAGIGSALSLIDPIAATLGDPDLKGQVTGLLQSNPKALGYFAIGVSVVTIAARLHSLNSIAAPAPPPPPPAA